MQWAGKRNRIMIIGQPGSGKSTLARHLGSKLNLPVVHIDLIHWQSGWIERNGHEKDRLCSDVHARCQWIFEGGHSNTWPERLDRADTLIWLDFPLWIRSYRIVKRRFEYHGTNRPDLPDGCPENINWEFVSFVWHTRHRARARMANLYDNVPANKDKFRLCHRKEVEPFLRDIA